MHEKIAPVRITQASSGGNLDSLRGSGEGARERGERKKNNEGKKGDKPVQQTQKNDTESNHKMFLNSAQD